MSKKTRQLIIFLAVFVVLLGATLALILSGKENETSSEVSSTVSEDDSVNGIALLVSARDQVDNILITNQEDSYNIDLTAAEDGTISFVIDEMENMIVGEGSADYIIKNLCTIYAHRDLGENAERMAYGLSEPTATIAVTYVDGTVKTLQIGDSVPDGDSYYYVSLDGDSHIYTARLVSYLFGSRYQNLTTDILEDTAYDSEGNEKTPDFGTIKFSGSKFPEPFEITKIPDKEIADVSDPLSMYAYMMNPGRYPVDTVDFEKLRDSLITLSAEGIVCVNPDAARLAEFGLDDPYVVLSYTVDFANRVLSVGKIENDMAYVMLEGRAVVYKVAVKNIPWVDVTKQDLRNDTVFTLHSTAISQVDIQTPTDKYEFYYKRTESTKSSSSDSKKYSYSIYYNKKALTYTSWTKVYQNLIGVTVDDVQVENYTVPEGATPALTITYHYYDEFNRQPTVVEMYDLGNRKMMYRLDGEDYAISNSKWISQIQTAVEKVLKDEGITVY